MTNVPIILSIFLECLIVELTTIVESQCIDADAFDYENFVVDCLETIQSLSLAFNTKR